MLAPLVGPREPREGRPKARRDGEHGVVSADGFVVGGRALFVDRRRAVAPSHARVVGEARHLRAELERRLGGDERVARLLGGPQQRAQRRGLAHARASPLAEERERLAGIAEPLLVQGAQALEAHASIVAVAEGRPFVRRRDDVGPGRRFGLDEAHHLVPPPELGIQALEQQQRRRVPGHGLEGASREGGGLRHVVQSRLGQLGGAQGQRGALGGVGAAAHGGHGQRHLRARVAHTRGDALEGPQRHGIGRAALEHAAQPRPRGLVIALVVLGEVGREAEARRRPVGVRRERRLGIEGLARPRPPPARDVILGGDGEQGRVLRRLGPRALDELARALRRAEPVPRERRGHGQPWRAPAALGRRLRLEHEAAEELGILPHARGDPAQARPRDAGRARRSILDLVERAPEQREGLRDAAGIALDELSKPGEHARALGPRRRARELALEHAAQEGPVRSPISNLLQRLERAPVGGQEGERLFEGRARGHRREQPILEQVGLLDEKIGALGHRGRRGGLGVEQLGGRPRAARLDGVHAQGREHRPERGRRGHGHGHLQVIGRRRAVPHAVLEHARGGVAQRARGDAFAQVGLLGRRERLGLPLRG